MPEQDLPIAMHKYLSKTAAFSSFPLSLLLLGLEKLIELEFVCPCGQSPLLTVFIFIAPSLFTFTLMYILLRPFKHGCSRCCADDDDNTRENCPKAFVSCLIPPVMWAVILLLNGDYVACVMTDWKGVYVFDKELNRSWCKPTDGMRNEMELRELTRKYIEQSQVSGYSIIVAFSALTIFVLGIYDCCCTRGKSSDSSERQDRRDDQEDLSLISVKRLE